MSQGAPSAFGVSLAGSGFIGTTAIQIPAYQTLTVVTTAASGNASISLPNIPQLGIEYKIVNQSSTSDYIMVYPSNYATGASRGTISGVACADATAAGKPTCFALSPNCYAKFVATALNANGVGATWIATEWTVGSERLVDAAAAANNRTLNIFDSRKKFFCPALTVGTQTLVTPTIAATNADFRIEVELAATVGQILTIGVPLAANINGVKAFAATTAAPVATIFGPSSTVSFAATGVCSDIIRFAHVSATAVSVYGQSCVANGITNA